MSQPGGDPKTAFLPAPGAAWTPISLTRWSGAYLQEKGVENGRLDAELILAHVLGVKRLDLYLRFDQPIRPSELEAFKALLLRRRTREPLQYVLGSTQFRELELRTDRRALIPRPETEVLVGEVLAWVGDQGTRMVGLDIGTGSGAIAFSLLEEGSLRSVVATDPSEEALDLARENAEALGYAQRVEFRTGPLFTPLRPGERFHVVVANPPYVAEEDRGSLDPEVREWEPGEALFAGPKGLDILLPLVGGVRPHLHDGGLFATEVGEGQGEVVARALVATGGFRDVAVRPDFSGRGRVVRGVASH